MRVGIAIFTILNICVGFYVARQLTYYTQLSTLGKALLSSSVMMLFMIFIGSFYLSMHARTTGSIPPLVETFFEVGLSCLAYVNFVIVLVFSRDLLAVILKYTTSIPVLNFYSTTATILLLTGAALLMGMGHLVVRSGTRIVEKNIYAQNLPEQMEGFKIVHLTDMHIGSSTPAPRIYEAVQKAQELKGDMIVLTGDILDAFPQMHQGELEALASLSAPYGVYVVLGNHEYYWNAELAVEAFQKAGLRVLINETDSHVINGKIMQISGIPDPAAQAMGLDMPDFKVLSETLNEESFKILLAHQPVYADTAAQYQYDLQLSGHTHGGQFFPWNFLIGFFQKYPKGLYQVGALQLYVNQGTGYWGPPLRLGTFCEITSITLHSVPRSPPHAQEHL